MEGEPQRVHCPEVRDMKSSSKLARHFCAAFTDRGWKLDRFVEPRGPSTAFGWRLSSLRMTFVELRWHLGSYDQTSQNYCLF